MRIRIVRLVIGSFSLCVGVVLAFSATTTSNSDVVLIRSYTILGKDDIVDSSTRSCLPVQLHEIRPPPQEDPNNRDNTEDATADYEFKRRAFLFPNPTTGNTPPEQQQLLEIRETSFGCGGLGATVWPSAIALACLLVSSSSSNDNDDVDTTTRNFIQGKRVLELGSGCGLPSLVAKEICHAHSILATDYWEEESSSSSNSSVEQDEDADRRSIPNELFRVNLAHNIGSNVADNNDDAAAAVEHLDWHDEKGIVAVATNFRPQVILGSDLVYYPEDTAPLLRTLELLLHAGEEDEDCAKEILLISPLRPAYSARKALPDFRARLHEGTLGERCEVQMDELELLGVGVKYGDEERHKFLRIRIHYVPNTTTTTTFS